MIGSTTKVIVQRQSAVRCNVPNAGVTKIKFIACSLMQCRTAGTLKRYAWGNQKRMTVGGLAHLKAFKGPLRIDDRQFEPVDPVKTHSAAA